MSVRFKRSSPCRTRYDRRLRRQCVRGRWMVVFSRLPAGPGRRIRPASRMTAGPERGMNDNDFGKWRPMASAPKNGSRILIAVRATEQGPAEVDVARWAKPDRWSEECWIAADSDPGCVIIYAEPELVSWMPLPTPVP